jgi:hypothetical protein
MNIFSASLPGKCDRIDLKPIQLSFMDWPGLTPRLRPIPVIVMVLIFASSSAFGQNVVLNPTGAQNITQPVSSGATTQFSANNIAGRRYVVAAYNWSQSPGGTLTSGTTNTITLTPCPVGVDVSNNVNAPYGVYISGGTGAAEMALVTGGTCSSGASSGNITVVPVNNHSGSWTVASANSGIQEALNDANALSPSTQGAVVDLSPTAGSNAANYVVHNTVFQKSSKSLVSGYGALLQCFTRVVCWIVGNYQGGAQFSTIEGIEFQPGDFDANTNVDGVHISTVAASSGTYTVTTSSSHPFVTGDYVILFYSNSTQTQEGRFQVKTGSSCSPSCSATQFQYTVGSNSFSAASSYGWVALEDAAIEDISDHLTIRNVKMTSGTDQHFSWGIVVGNDQSFKLDGLSNEGNGAVIQCTSNFCGAMVYGRGDQGAAPVMNIDHAEISMQCGGNGIRYSSGNTLHVWNSVVQGFNQYGIYYGGGLQNVMTGGVYQESGNCTNPFYPSCAGGTTCGSSSGIITNNDLTYLGDDPIGGQLPSFLAANPGSQQNNYFVVINSSAQGGNVGMYFIGSCLTTGSGNCSTYWPRPNLDTLGTVTYDVLVTVGASAIPPNGTGSYRVSPSTGVADTSCNTSGICTFVDPQTGTSSYTVSSAVAGPHFNFWPGGFVLSSLARLHINDCGQASSIVATSYLPSVFCNKGVFSTSAQRSPYWATFKDGDSEGNGNPAVGAILQQAGPASGSGSSALTGLYGFLSTADLGQTDMITLAYTSPFLTLATPGYRPAASATDTAIGFDSASASSPTSAQLAFRAPVAISNYIDGTFDGASYKETLTSSAKAFSVPICVILKATAALASGQPVKADTSNAGDVVKTTTTDTGSGIVVGVVVNSPSASGAAYVADAGIVAMTLGSGSCSIGNWIIVDTTTNGDVKCTSSYPAAGTIIGVAMAADSTVGTKFNVLVGLK